MSDALTFDRQGDDFRIFLIDRDAPLGAMRPYRGRWVGVLKLYGKTAVLVADTPRIIADELSAWAAAGAPSDSILLRPDRETRKAAAAVQAHLLLSASNA